MILTIRRQCLYAIVIQSIVISHALSMEKAGNDARLEKLSAEVTAIRNRIQSIWQEGDAAVRNINRSTAIAILASDNANKALQNAQAALEQANNSTRLTTASVAFVNQIDTLQTHIEQEAQAAHAARMDAEKYVQEAAANIENTYNRLRTDFQTLAHQQSIHSTEESIQMEIAKINEKQKRGIFEQEARIKAQASVEVENTRWINIQHIIDDPIRLAKIVVTIAAIALIIYTAKYGIPWLIQYITQPHVITETSKTHWLGFGDTSQKKDSSHLIFTPSLQKKLIELVVRIQSAKMYNAALPNLLFYGEPGTGKTAFAKALAYESGLNYALTSGSEFAKITDLTIANNELRNLLEWAKNDDKGLLIFIDEAESLFANRTLHTTTKAVQDFINTFLALIPDKSQKNLMFIFATNHPFKLDDAIIDRIGTKIEFTLPEAPEREKILAMYLKKCAQENKNALVDIHPKVIEMLTTYANNLNGLSPRSIKFIAEEIIFRAQQQKDMILTPEIAQSVIADAVQEYQATSAWTHERDQWVAAAR